MRRAWLILLMLAGAGCSAPAPVEATPAPVLIPVAELGEGIFHITDLSPDVTGEPAVYDNTADNRLWMVVAVCPGAEQTDLGVLPFKSLTTDILTRAQAREFDSLIPDC